MNETLQALLTSHLKRYPLMQAEDILKLLYQRNFGCGHLVTDISQALSYMKEEWSTLKPETAGQAYEPLGNGFGRIYLRTARERGISPEALTRLLYLSANRPPELLPGAEQFLRECNELLEPCNTEQTEACKTLQTKPCNTLQTEPSSASAGAVFPFSCSRLRSLISDCQSTSFRPFHHSEEYRKQYRPAYRVVAECFLPLLPLLELPELLTDPAADVYTIAIDGRCASGKTTLAGHLSEILQAPVISMDDFFLPPDLRSQDRLSQPGGNIHYERFEQEVVPFLKQASSFQYHRFHCQGGNCTELVTIPASRIRIVEGAYCLRPEWRSLYDSTLFLTVSPELQRARILVRNGSDLLARFLTHWIPMEEHYIQANAEYLTQILNLNLS